jgi:hypothetical protein
MRRSDRERMEKLKALKRESGISIQSAQREERVGPKAAYREELARRAHWRADRKSRRA